MIPKIEKIGNFKFHYILVHIYPWPSSYIKYINPNRYFSIKGINNFLPVLDKEMIFDFDFIDLEYEHLNEKWNVETHQIRVEKNSFLSTVVIFMTQLVKK